MWEWTEIDLEWTGGDRSIWGGGGRRSIWEWLGGTRHWQGNARAPWAVRTLHHVKHPGMRMVERQMIENIRTLPTKTDATHIFETSRPNTDCTAPP